MIYKSVQTLSLVLSLAFFMIGIAGAQEAAQAPVSPYIVEGVEVDITAKNAIEARDQAFNTAQEKAFGVLAERMLSEEDFKNFKSPGLSSISTLIKDYEVTKEKLSSVRYIGTYTFHFDEDGVRRLFGSSGQTYSDVRSPPLLILPFYQVNAEVTLWSSDNLWMNAWNRAENNRQSLVPMVMPIGDLEDVQDVGDNEALNYDERKLADIVKRYGADEAVILVANPDGQLANAASEDDPATGSLSVNIYRTDQGTPEFAQEIIVSSQQGQTLGQIMDTAVIRVQGVLKQDWKERSMATVAEESGGMIDVIIPIRSLADWSAAQDSLESVSSVRDIMLKSLSPREARVSISYRGSQERFMMGLEQVGLALVKTAPEAGSESRLFVPATYILTSKSAAREMIQEREMPVQQPRPYSRQF